MAIEKINLRSSISIAEELKNLYNFLHNNAVPEYFDSIVFDKINDKINCTINGRQFLQFGTTLSDGVVITLASGEITRLYMYNDGSAFPHSYDCVYKCKNGFSIGTVVSGKISEPRLTITKDNAGNTVVIGDASTGGNIPTLSAINRNTVNASLRISVHPNTSSVNTRVGLTGLCPIAVSDTENYTPNVFVMVYAQNRSEGILTIDDITYWSNGLWCIKDE